MALRAQILPSGPATTSRLRCQGLPGPSSHSRALLSWPSLGSCKLKASPAPARQQEHRNRKQTGTQGVNLIVGVYRWMLLSCDTSMQVMRVFISCACTLSTQGHARLRCCALYARSVAGTARCIPLRKQSAGAVASCSSRALLLPLSPTSCNITRASVPAFLHTAQQMKGSSPSVIHNADPGIEGTVTRNILPGHCNDCTYRGGYCFPDQASCLSNWGPITTTL
jgi:hypothetical protein